MINMHLIFDELTFFTPESHLREDISRDLCGVRLLSENINCLESMYLYVIEETQINKITQNNEKLHFLIIGKRQKEYIFSQNWQSIIISSHFNPMEVLSTLQEVFDKYSVWHEKMLWMIANKYPIQEIFTNGIKFLKNPIAMFDSSWTLMMRGGSFPNKIEDPIWLDVLQTGYTTLENMNIRKQSELSQKVETEQEPFLMSSITGEKDAYLAVALFKAGKRFAAFGSVNINSPFTKGQIAIVDILKKMIEAAFLHDNIHSDIADGMSFHINKLLQGFSIDDGTVSHYISKLKWGIHDNYVLLYFEPFNKGVLDISLKMQHVYRINRSLNDAYISPYENGVLAIVHANIKYLFTEEFRNKFSDLLKKFDLVCGVSMPFGDFMNLRSAQIQAKTAITDSYLKKDVYIYDFKTHYLDHIVSAIDISTNINSMCHPKLLQLIERNDIKGKELIQTLYIYLLSGRNASSTAKLLHVHRNTLVYRLNTLNQFLNDDLNNLDENSMLILFISCLIIKKIYKDKNL